MSTEAPVQKRADEVDLTATTPDETAKKHATNLVDDGTSSSAKTMDKLQPAQTKGTPKSTIWERLDNDVKAVENDIKSVMKNPVERDLAITVIVMSAVVLALGIAMTVMSLRHKKAHGTYFPAAQKSTSVAARPAAPLPFMRRSVGMPPVPPS